MIHRIRTEPAGHEFAASADQSILASALAARIALPYGCRNGRCGSCLARLRAGRVVYPEGPPEALAGHGPDACLTCQARPCSDLVLEVAELTGLADLAPRILPARLQEKTPLNHDVVRLRLKLPEGQRLRYLAGQYLDLLLPEGRRRAFSIANPPHDDDLLELHVRRVPGGWFTGAFLDQLPPRAILRIQAPLGTFVWRQDSTRPALFIAGGTGFAPIKAMLEHAFHTGCTRPKTLYWGVRSRRDLYLPELPERWSREHSGFRFIPVLSAPDPDWPGRRGYVHEAVAADHADVRGFDLYLSGPPAMVAAGRRVLEARGAAPTQLFSDAFDYAADRGPGSAG